MIVLTSLLHVLILLPFVYAEQETLSTSTTKSGEQGDLPQACQNLLIDNGAILFKNCRIPVFQIDFLRSISNLREIYLNNSGIEMIAPRAFSIESLQKLQLSSNSIRNLSKDSFESMPNLQILDLSKNQLVDIDIKALDNLTSLRTLNLSNNNFKAIDGYNLRSLTQLEVLDLSHNSLYSLSSSFLSGHQSLQTLHLQHNKLSLINLQIRSLKIIDASYNTIRNVNLPDLLRLQLNNNNIVDINFKDIYVILSNNNITNFRALSENTRYVDLSGNQLVGISTLYFPNAKLLEYLDMSNNLISNIENQALSTLKLVKSINLSHNKLVDLKNRVFDNLNSLEDLDVSYNSFIYLYDIPFAGPFSIDNLASLKNIILNNNPWACKFLKELSKTTLTVVGAHTTCKSDINDFVIDFDKVVPVESDIRPPSDVNNFDDVAKLLHAYFQTDFMNTTVYKLITNTNSKIEQSNDGQRKEDVANLYEYLANLSRPNSISNNKYIEIQGVNKSELVKNPFIKNELFSYILLTNTIMIALVLVLVIIIVICKLCKKTKYKVENYEDAY